MQLVGASIFLGTQYKLDKIDNLIQKDKETTDAELETASIEIFKQI